MKNNSNKITLIYFVILITSVFLTQKILSENLNIGNENLYPLTQKDIVLIIISICLFRYFLFINEKHNQGVLDKLRKSNQDIIESKERYDIVAKATSDTIWDWKIDNDTFIWNKGIQGVFGYKKEEVGKTSKWWFDRIHPEDSIKMSIKLYSFIEQKTEKWQDEYRFKCADGTYKYVFDRGFLVKDEEGNAIRMIGAIQDVTKQKEEEQRLKLLETVITQTKDAVIITESEKQSKTIPKIVFVNPAFTEMTGYKSSEVIGKTPIVFMGRKSVKNEIGNLSKALKGREEFKFETT